MITAFLPCRSGSERVKNKNTRKFAHIEGGLVKIKIQQLLDAKKIDQIILSTNDPAVIDIAQQFKNDRIKIDNRPESLALSSTSTDDLIKYVPSIIKEGIVIWTHTTSPFVDGKIYDEAIKRYYEVLSEGYDSLMSTHKLQTFLWTSDGPYNYDKSIEKWPRTQTIKPLYEVNSAFFISNRNCYINQNDRIGINPYFYQLSKLETVDIDWEEDFCLAEMLWKIQGKTI